MNSVWICSPAFKGQGIIPLGVERLDDLVLGRKKTALQGILREAFTGKTQMPASEVAEFVTSLVTEEELADWCWRLLKTEFKSGPSGAQAVLDLIAKHAQA
ncbi:hypothetical protein HY415_02255 [Candidatus Kaiserbacteria bacterium]|nr:hypothetical protein [Candidatus Kaiserbacteria bacterium]